MNPKTNRATELAELTKKINDLNNSKVPLTKEQQTENSRLLAARKALAEKADAEPTPAANRGDADKE